MADKNKKVYNEYSLDQLRGALSELEKSYQEYRFEKVIGDARQTHQLKQARKDIARIKTYIRQYELGIKK